NISQLPVLHDDEVVGSIQETEVMRLLLEKVDLASTTIREVMGRPFPQLAADTDVADACYSMADGSAVLVVADRRPVGVLTKIDFIHYLAEIDRK
ncbi:MAG: CBS domain-containing protein, partial [Candidatus Sericytochromatia bacterium]